MPCTKSTRWLFCPADATISLAPPKFQLMKESLVEKSGHLEAPTHGLRTKRWGGFTIFYDSLYPQLPLLTALKSAYPSLTSSNLRRAFHDVRTVSPRLWAAYSMVEIWLVISSLFLLYAGFSVASVLDVPSEHGMSAMTHATATWILACGWTIAEVSQPLVKALRTQLEWRLGGKLRRRFFPLMAEASLKIRAGPSEDRAEPPQDWCSLYNAPLMPYVRDLLTGLRHHLSFVFQISFLVYLVCLNDTLDWATRVYLGTLALLSLIAPMNSAGGTGFTFWTDNIDFHRLNNLHHTIFSLEYQDTLQKNHADALILEDYRRTLDAVGAPHITPLQILQFDPAWVWRLARTIVFRIPLPLGLLLILSGLSDCSLGNILFVYYVSIKIKKSMADLQTYRPSDFSYAIRGIEEFYTALDYLSITEHNERRRSQYDTTSGENITFENSPSHGPSGTPTTSSEVLLPLTLAENILLGACNSNSNPQIRHSNLIEAARQTQCLDLLLEHGGAIVTGWPGILAHSGEHAGFIGPAANGVLTRKEATAKKYIPSEAEKQKILAAREFIRHLVTQRTDATVLK